MKRFSSLLSQLACACALFLNDFCYADNVNEESFFLKNKEVLPWYSSGEIGDQ